MYKRASTIHLAAFSAAALGLSGCGPMDFAALDFDLRGGAGQLDTTDAVRSATQAAPLPDSRGIVSYPDYQVAVAQRDDTVETVAARVGVPAQDLARYNALPTGVTLRAGEVLALPVRVSEPSASPAGTGVDVATIAGSAIDRAEAQATPGLPSGDAPTRHRVEAGETAFSIARRYDVPVASLADWNGLGDDLQLRVGQYLLIPTKNTEEVQVAALAPPNAPGTGSDAPPPPSSAEPLPLEDVTPRAEVEDETPAPAPLAQQQTAASDNSRLRMPVAGRIIRPFGGGSDGIGIAADTGATVVAADNGTVAAITRDTDQVPILVIRHADNLLTVYAGVDDIEVQKGDSVKRGQKIAEVRGGDPSYLHFEVREGFESVDPLPYLN